MKNFWNTKAQEPGAITPEQGPDEGAVNSLLCNIPAQELEGSSLLDLGCGEGRLLAILSKRVAKYTGADISSVALSRARELVTKKDLHNVTLIELPEGEKGILGDIGLFDIVVSYTVFMHLPPEIVEAYMKSIHDALKTRGYFNFQMAAAVHPRFDRIPKDDFWTSRYYPDLWVVEHLKKVGFGIAGVPVGLSECWLTIRMD